MRNKIVQEDMKYIVDYLLPWKKFEGKTVLISGANGFLASYMVKALLYFNDKTRGRKVKVICCARNQSKSTERFEEYKYRDDIKFVFQDICDPIAVDGDVHYIIHAASQASPKYYGVDPVGTLLANVLGTYNLLELARQKKVEGLLYFSSGEVYGEVTEKQLPTKESDYGYVDPANVRSCYAESKRMGENMCVSWAHQFGVPAKIARPFHTYGPGMSLDDGRVFADFVADIVNGKNILMKSDGSATRSFCYLADATIGFFLVLLTGEVGQAYNVGNDKGEISIYELAQTLVRLFPEKGLKVIREERGDNQAYLKSKISRSCPDTSKIRAMGWEPMFSVEDGFRRTIRSWNYQ